jgi:hypothetical protein
LYNHVSAGQEYNLCKFTALSQFILFSYLPVRSFEHVMFVLAPFSSEPANLPHISASLPIIPFLAGVLLTKTRAFMNWSPQQLTLLSNKKHKLIKPSNH